MDMKILLEQCNENLDAWIQALAQYEEAELLLKPAADSWSIGQVCVHLIEETQYYILEMEACLANKINIAEEMSNYAKNWFQNNAFPNEQLQGMAAPLQPKSKAQVLEGMQQLKQNLNDIGKKIAVHKHTGKTQHPGHQYFNAAEWFQYAVMHIRHHWRQKERIDAFLNQLA